MAKARTYEQRLGDRLKALRKATDKLQKEVCAEVGLETYELSRYENGKAALPFKAGLALAKCYKVPPLALDPGTFLSEDQLMLMLRAAHAHLLGTPPPQAAAGGAN